MWPDEDGVERTSVIVAVGESQYRPVATQEFLRRKNRPNHIGEILKKTHLRLSLHLPVLCVRIFSLSLFNFYVKHILRPSKR